MRFGLYVRKSTEEDERQAQSIDDQVRVGRDFAGRNGFEIAEVFSESMSAKEEGRPEFSRLLSEIDAGRLGGVIAWHPDRLSRNETDAAAITKRARKGVIRELSFVNYYFQNSPEGIMMLQIALSQSQYFSSKLSTDVKRGLASKIRKGWWPHRALPGYVNDTHKEKGEKTISPDAERFPVIRRMFDYFLTSAYNGADLARILNEDWGYRSRKTKHGGDAPMSKTTVYRLLGSVFYAGYFVEKGELIEGKHVPMITMDEYRRVQEILGRLSRTQPKRHDFSYAGVIRCAGCATLLVSQQNVNRYGSRYVYYRCRRCSRYAVSDETLQKQIDAEVDRVALIPDFVEWALEEVRDWKPAERESQRAVSDQRRSSLSSIDAQLDALLTALTKGLVTDDEYRERKNRLQAEQAGLRADLARVEGEAERVREAIENEIHFLRNVKLWMSGGDPRLRRACLVALGTNFLLDGRNLLLEPHPLLVRVREENKALEAKYLAVKLDETLSETTKKGLIEPIRSAWSRIWNHNQTLVTVSGISFPRIPTSGPQVSLQIGERPHKASAG